MAQATLTFTQSQYPNGQDQTERSEIRRGTLVFGSTNNYYTYGLPLSIGNLNLSNIVPYKGIIQSQAGSGFIYVFCIADVWVKNTVVVAGQSITDANGNLQRVTTGGTTNNTAEPTWNTTAAGTTTDGTVTWTNEGVSQGTVRVYESGAGSGTISLVTGTNSAPTISLAAGDAGASVTIGTTGSTVTLANGTNGATLTGLIGVQAPIFTGAAQTFTGTGGGLVEIPSAATVPASVTGDSIFAEFWLRKG